MSLGDTASITLVTGLPGSGKSLRFAEEISKAVERGEHVFACNIDGLKIKGVTPFEDARRWRELPPGSVLFVDEAQVFFPERRGGEPPEYVRMNKIRHDGIRIVLATQQPNYLDSYLRGLVGRHEHLLRRHGKQESFMFMDNQVMDNVRQKLAVIKRTYDYRVYKFNPKYFDCYESAQTHTIKYQMPALVKKALIFGPIAVVLMAVAWYSVFKDSSLAEREEAAKPAPPAAAPMAASSARPGAPVNSVATAEDYVGNLVPQVADVPWTAPAWIGRPVVSDPHLYCMSTESTCRCVTEQNTPPLAPVRDDVCRQIARWGEPYNPHKPPAPVSLQERRQEPRQEPGRDGAGDRGESAQAAPGAIVRGDVATVVGSGVKL
jgi:ATPases of the AAA+ class